MEAKNLNELWDLGIIAPWYLRESQKDIYLVLLKNKNPFIECARRFGKTTTILVYVVERLLQNANWVCTWCEPWKSQAREIVMPEMEKIFSSAPKYLKPVFISTDSYYLFPNGSKIKLRGVNDDKGNSARGPASEIIVADEFGFWSHAEYIVNSALRPQLLTTKGQFLFASTPSDDLDHAYYIHRDHAFRENRFIQKTIYENESLTEEEIEKAANEVGGKDSISWRREYLCEAISDPERLVIPEYRDDLHLITGDYSRPTYYTPYVGIDLGFNDNTFAVFAYYDFKEATLVVEEELCVSGKNSREISEAAKAIEEKYWGSLKPQRWCDNDLQQIHDLNTLCGYLVYATKKDDRLAAINSLRLKFQMGKIKIHERCKNLIYQIKVGLWNSSRKDFERGERIGHLDGIAALVYLNRNINERQNPYPQIPEGVTRETHYIPNELSQSSDHRELAKAFNRFGRI